MPWTHDVDDKIYRCIRWYYRFIAALLNVSMQITKYMFIRVIKIFIFYMVSTTTCVLINAYMNIPWFTFLKGPLSHIQLSVLIHESLIEFSLCRVKEVFDMGSHYVEHLLSFSTYIWLDEGLVWSCQNVCTNSLTASISFISRQGNLPTKAQQSFPPGVYRFSLITEYF